MLFSRKDIVRLIWPLLIEQLLSVLVGMVDVIMVASLGEEAVSGVSLVDSISMLMIQVSSALATGGAVVCSQYVGRKDTPSACRAAGQLILSAVSAASFIAVFCLIGGKGLLRLIFGSVDALVMENARTYFMFMAFSYPFLALYNSSAALFRSMGNSRISMLVSLGMNVLNVGGNALCIFVLKMGVAGVALPTLISRAAGALFMTVLLKNPKLQIHVSSIRELKPQGRMIKNILSVGIPNGLENGMFQLGKLMLSSLVSTQGTAAIAGYAVASSLVTFLYLPGNAMSLAMLTIVGQCVGANEYKQAKKYAWLLIGVNYAFLAFVSTVMGFGRGLFVSFYNLSADAAQIASAMVLIHSIAMIIWPPAFCLPNALRAGMDTKFTMIVSAAIMWIFRVGGAYFFLMVLKTNILGVWYAMFIDWIVRVVVYLLRFRKFETRIRQVS